MASSDGDDAPYIPLAGGAEAPEPTVRLELEADDTQATQAAFRRVFMGRPAPQVELRVDPRLFYERLDLIYAAAHAVVPREVEEQLNEAMERLYDDYAQLITEACTQEDVAKVSKYCREILKEAAAKFQHEAGVKKLLPIESFLSALTQRSRARLRDEAGGERVNSAIDEIATPLSMPMSDDSTREYVRVSIPIYHLSDKQLAEWKSVLNDDETKQPKWFTALDKNLQAIIKRALNDALSGIEDDEARNKALIKVVGHLSSTYRGLPGLANCWVEKLYRVEGGAQVEIESARRLRIGILDPYNIKDKGERRRILAQNYEALREVADEQDLGGAMAEMALQTLVKPMPGFGERGMITELERFVTDKSRYINARLNKTSVSYGNFWRRARGNQSELQPKHGSHERRAIDALQNISLGILRGSCDYEYAYRAALQSEAYREAGLIDVGGCKSGKDREGAKSIFLTAIQIYKDAHPGKALPMPPSASWNWRISGAFGLRKAEASPGWKEIEAIAVRVMLSQHDFTIAATNCPGAHGIKEAERLFGKSIMEKYHTTVEAAFGDGATPPSPSHLAKNNKVRGGSVPPTRQAVAEALEQAGFLERHEAPDEEERRQLIADRIASGQDPLGGLRVQDDDVGSGRSHKRGSRRGH